MTTISYSRKQPFFKDKDRKQLRDCFIEEMKKADKLIITAAFSSGYSLYALDKWVEQCKIKNVCVILGMYYFVEPLEKIYKAAVKINDKWQRAGIGEIRVIHSSKYHGKIYCFIKNNQIFSAIFGSPNLSFLHQPSQYWEEQVETATLIRDPELLQDFLMHAEEMQLEDFSNNISSFEWEKIVYTENVICETKKICKIRLTKRI